MTTLAVRQAKPLFALGKTVATPGALLIMQAQGISPLAVLSRHQRGDWGDMDDDDKAANVDAIKTGNRIFSTYQFDAVRLWVVTEADRSATTILLPEEY